LVFFQILQYIFLDNLINTIQKLLTMNRRILSIVLFTLMIASCNNQGSKVSPAKSETNEGPLKVEFASLISNPDKYMGKDIVVEGKVVHVCTESGKKLFIVGDNPDVRLYVAAGENMPKFPMELLGSEISVEGVITRIGGPATPKSEKTSGKNDEAAQKQGMSDDSCETETAMAGQASLADIIMLYRSHTVK